MVLYKNNDVNFQFTDYGVHIVARAVFTFQHLIRTDRTALFLLECADVPRMVQYVTVAVASTLLDMRTMSTCAMPQDVTCYYFVWVCRVSCRSNHNMRRRYGEMEFVHISNKLGLGCTEFDFWRNLYIFLQRWTKYYTDTFISSISLSINV